MCVYIFEVKTLVSTGTEFGVLTNDGYFFSWDNDLENKSLHEVTFFMHFLDFQIV